MLFGKRNTGRIDLEIVSGVRRLECDLCAVVACYGIGSYFSENDFNDVDLVVVVDDECASKLVRVGSQIRSAFGGVALVAGVPVDVTIFTFSEFGEAPLRDMSNLIPLYRRSPDRPVGGAN